jgi:hypothetical protein
MTRTYIIIHDGLTYRVTAVRYPGYAATMEDPAEEESADIRCVNVLNEDGTATDMTDDLSDELYYALEQAWLDAWHDEAMSQI